MKKQKTTLIAIIAITLLPFVLAVFLFNRHYTGKTTQAGKLVSPIVDLSKLGIKATNHRWQLLYVSNQPCSSQCRVVIKNFKQILNIHQTELNRLMVSIIANEKSSWLKPLQSMPDNSYNFILLTTKKSNFLLKQLSEKSAAIALIDPRGFIPLKYSNENWPINLNKDLKKLMKQS